MAASDDIKNSQSKLQAIANKQKTVTDQIANEQQNLQNLQRDMEKRQQLVNGLNDQLNDLNKQHDAEMSHLQQAQQQLNQEVQNL